MPRAADLITFLVVAFFSAASPASADVLCKTRRSKVVVRTACRAEETPLNVGALGLRGEKGDPGEQGPPGPGLIVKDANGAFVGTVVRSNGLGSHVKVVRSLGAEFVELAVWANGFDQTGNARRYETTDCSGQAFVSFMDDPEALVVSPLVVLDVAVYARGPGTSREIQSAINPLPLDNCTAVGGTFNDGLCCIPFPPQSTHVAPAVEVDLASLALIPPFHVEEQ
jgi:hypothetical protein